MLKPKKCFDNVSLRASGFRLLDQMSHLRSQMICDLPFQEIHTVTMNADYWEQRTALIRDGAVRVLSLSKPEEVDYWRDELKSNRRNSHEIELMTWGNHTSTLRGRADYGRSDEVAEYLFQFIRTSEGKLLKFGTVAFSKSVDRALARHVIDIVGTKN